MSLQLPNKPYVVVCADPPWKYSFSKSGNRDIENHYPTMNVADICNLKVYTAPDSVLYLWATAPKLVEALTVMAAWGFTYKTNAIWDKQIIGMGYWFRGQHELLLVGTKGNISPPNQSTRTSSIFSVRRSTHSSKPSEIRQHIETWFPSVLKLEMFARDYYTGWDVWGNEVPSLIDEKEAA